MQYSKAFSSFELVCVLVIIAIFTSFSLRSLHSMQQKMCLNTLKTKLTRTQNALTNHYTQSFLLNIPSDPNAAYILLSKLQENANTRCGFSFHTNILTAHIGDKQLNFFIEPASLQSNPRLYCPLSAPLCKEFSNRTLNK